MNSSSRRWSIGLLFICFILLLSLPVQAEDAAATDISGLGLVKESEGFQHIETLFDRNIFRGYSFRGPCSLTLQHDDGIGSLYIIFDELCGEYTVIDNTTGTSQTVNQDPFLHQFIDLQALFGTVPTEITLQFAQESVRIVELQAFTAGEVPDSVQKWEPSLDGGADLVLFSTHGDDEQLFFAGVLPYYAGERDYRVQVVYFTNHRMEHPHRVHEMLNGLWAVGVKAYPVWENRPDFFLRNKVADTYRALELWGYPREDLLQWVVENIRRFKPLVAVGHDINGEYQHSMHMVYTDLLREALEISNDPTYDPESAAKYGLWDVPKTYLHLYKENEIIMDWDQPLENFNGMTAFEVTQQLGFPCHISQYADFMWYHLSAKNATEVALYNPCYYGLYRSTVGPDVAKNDFFENIIPYDEQARLEEEARLEQERLAAEAEAKRLEEERRLEEEAKRKAEQERLAAEAEAKRAEEEARLAEEQRIAEQARMRRNQNLIMGTITAVLIVLFIIVLICLFRKLRHRK